MIVIVTAAGAFAYNVDVPTNTMPAFVVAVAVGAATFSSRGWAAASFIPNADASPAIVNASIVPLLIISDVFIPLNDTPAWLTSFAFSGETYLFGGSNSFQPL